MAQSPLLKKARVEESISDSKPWVEKYRPKTLDEVQSQEEAVNALRACLRKGANMPHFLFYGPPGTGKTTAILAVAFELFGPDYTHVRVRELNASDDRGIQVIREKVKVFAQTAVGNVGQKVQSDGKIYPMPQFKLIILDEADALLPDAQAALRRMMEDFSDVTRFCILCNYVSRIIDPIASRCAKYRFKPLVRHALYDRIRQVAEAEKLTISEKSLEALDRVSGGDLRLAITYLQYAQKAHGSDLTNEDFVTVSGSVPEGLLLTYTQALVSKSFDEMFAVTKQIVYEGFSAGQLLLELQCFLVSATCPFNSAQRGAIALKLCDVERRLSDGGDELVQLLDLGAAICSVDVPPNDKMEEADSVCIPSAQQGELKNAFDDYELDDKKDVDAFAEIGDKRCAANNDELYELESDRSPPRPTAAIAPTPPPLPPPSSCRGSADLSGPDSALQNGTASAMLGGSGLAELSGPGSGEQNGAAWEELGETGLAEPNGQHSGEQNGAAWEELGGSGVAAIRGAGLAEQNGPHSGEQNDAAWEELGETGLAEPNGPHSGEQNGTAREELSGSGLAELRGPGSGEQNGTASAMLGGSGLAELRGPGSGEQNGTASGTHSGSGLVGLSGLGMGELGGPGLAEFSGPGLTELSGAAWVELSGVGSEPLPPPQPKPSGSAGSLDARSPTAAPLARKPQCPPGRPAKGGANSRSRANETGNPSEVKLPSITSHSKKKKSPSRHSHHSPTAKRKKTSSQQRVSKRSSPGRKAQSTPKKISPVYKKKIINALCVANFPAALEHYEVGDKNAEVVQSAFDVFEGLSMHSTEIVPDYLRVYLTYFAPPSVAFHEAHNIFEEECDNKEKLEFHEFLYYGERLQSRVVAHRNFSTMGNQEKIEAIASRVLPTPIPDETDDMLESLIKLLDNEAEDGVGSQPLRIYERLFIATMQKNMESQGEGGDSYKTMDKENTEQWRELSYSRSHKVNKHERTNSSRTKECISREANGERSEARKVSCENHKKKTDNTPVVPVKSQQSAKENRQLCAQKESPRVRENEKMTRRNMLMAEASMRETRDPWDISLSYSLKKHKRRSSSMPNFEIGYEQRRQKDDMLIRLLEELYNKPEVAVPSTA